MAYYETNQDRIREFKVMTQAAKIYPELSSHTWEQRPQDLEGAIYDFFGRSNNRVLLPDYYAEVKVLHPTQNYPNNIISVEKIDFMKANPQYEYYFLAYYTHFNKFRLRKILPQYLEYIENFRHLHKRESQRQGRNVYFNKPVYFITSPMHESVTYVHK